MENSFQTSFIPKKPVNTTIKAQRPPTSLLTTFAFFVLILVGLASGGLYLYKNYLSNQKLVLSTSLQKVRDSFERDTINELELYDKRTSAAQKILSNHIVLSPMFALLGSLTIPSIQYTKFEQDSNAQGFEVKMSGTATDYKSIALQADVFNTASGRSFKNVVFSNLTKDKNNKVNFDVDFTVDPALLSYQRNLALEQAQGLSNSSPQATTPDQNSTPISNTTIPATSFPTTPSNTTTTTPDQALPANNPNQALPGNTNTNIGTNPNQ